MRTFQWFKTVGLCFFLTTIMVFADLASITDAATKKKAPVVLKSDLALGFLRSRIGPVGLLDSFVEDGTDFSYTYDDALAAMAFLAANDVTSAQKVLDAFILIPPAPEGGFMHRYHATDGTADGVLGAGHNAYLLQAMNVYYQKTGDVRYNTVAHLIADYLVSLQDTDGGLFGRADVTWKSTENNVGALTALHNFGMLHNLPFYTNKAELIRLFITTELWNGTRFLNGKNDPMIVTDPQALGAIVLGRTYSQGAYWIMKQTMLRKAMVIKNASGRSIKAHIVGFDENIDRDTIWTEGTLQETLAFLVTGNLGRSNGFKAEAEKLIQTSGAFLQATNTGTTGFGDLFQPWQAVAPTAWYVFVAYTTNPLALI